MANKVVIVDDSVAGASVERTMVPGSNITDASVAHSLNATYSHTEAETALNALGTKINSILAILDTTGITA